MQATLIFTTLVFITRLAKIVDFFYLEWVKMVGKTKTKNETFIISHADGFLGIIFTQGNE